MEELSRALAGALNIGGGKLVSVSISGSLEIASVEVALGVVSALEQKFRSKCDLKEPMPAEDLPVMAAALSSLKAFLERSKESEFVLQQRIGNLERELHSAYTELSQVKSDLLDVQARLSVVEKRDTPITVREVMRKLEDELSKEAAASLPALNASEKKLLYNFKRFKDAATDPDMPPALRTPDVPAALAAVLAARGLSACSACIGLLKKRGDTAAHGSRPQLSPSELESLITAELDATTASAFLNALAHYFPKPASRDAPWKIV